MDNRLKLWQSKVSRYGAFLLIMVLFIGSASPANAQSFAGTSSESISGTPELGADSSSDESRSTGSRFGRIARSIGNDQWHFIKAPFKKSAIPWDILVLGGTAALALSGADENIAHDVPTGWHETSHNISNGCIYGVSALTTGIYLGGLVRKSEHAQETGIRTAEAVADSVIMYGAMKIITQRQRPFSGDGEGRFFAGNWKHGSYPSGHAMFTWTIASTVAHRYHSVPLDLLLYGVATTMSGVRITGGQHFPSDVLAGSVLGYLIGDYVANKPENGFPIRTQSKFRRVQNAILSHVSIELQ